MTSYARKVLNFLPRCSTAVRDAHQHDGEVNYATAFAYLATFYDMAWLQFAALVAALEREEAAKAAARRGRVEPDPEDDEEEDTPLVTIEEAAGMTT